MSDASALAAYRLHAACLSGALDDVRALLRGGAPVDGRVSDEARRRGTTPLIVASRQGHLDVVGTLLVSGTAVDLPKARGSTALLIAAQVRLPLLKASADIDHGLTPLMTAAINGQLASLRVLVELGANTAATTIVGQTAADLAQLRNHTNCAHWMRRCCALRL